MVRLGIGEADRLPELAAGLFDVLFGVTTGNLAAHLVTASGLAPDEAEIVANELIGLAIHPALPRLLFGVDPLTEEVPDLVRLATDVDLERIRRLLRLLMPPPTET
jgi:TetR/AcrR family transcriptional regulator of autoinduction and epiphytic fitness